MRNDGKFIFLNFECPTLIYWMKSKKKTGEEKAARMRLAKVGIVIV